MTTGCLYLGYTVGQIWSNFMYLKTGRISTVENSTDQIFISSFNDVLAGPFTVCNRMKMLRIFILLMKVPYC